MKKKIFYALCLLFVLILSFYVVFITNRYNVLIGHDAGVFCNRTFLTPEHGRYISTFVTNLFVERLPLYFNIHPNDFQQSFAAPFKAILTIILCLLLTASAFVFSKKKFNPINPAFILIYILMFLSVFNNNYVCQYDMSYLRIAENTVFFEYPMSLLSYIPFLSFIAYF